MLLAFLSSLSYLGFCFLVFTFCLLGLLPSLAHHLACFLAAGLQPCHSFDFFLGGLWLIAVLVVHTLLHRARARTRTFTSLHEIYPYVIIKVSLSIYLLSFLLPSCIRSQQRRCPQKGTTGDDPNKHHGHKRQVLHQVDHHRVQGLHVQGRSIPTSFPICASSCPSSCVVIFLLLLLVLLLPQAWESG